MSQRPWNGWCGRRALGRLLLVVVACVVWAALGRAPVALAAGFVVNSLTNDQDAAPGNGVCATAGAVCSLRAAVMEANALPGADTVTVPAGLIDLSAGGNGAAGEDGALTGDLDLNSSMTIQGAGVSATFVGRVSDRVIHVRNGAQVTLRDLTICEGFAPGTGRLGGGILIEAGASATLINVVVGRAEPTCGRHDADQGGGIANFGVATLVNVTVIGNDADSLGGGGIFNAGTLIMTGGAVTDNKCDVDCAGGSGILNTGAMTLTNVTVDGNGEPTSAALGGGIRTTGSLTMTGGVVRNNTAGGDDGGGISNAGALRLFGVTVSGNDAEDGGGVDNHAPGLALLSNVIISGNTTTNTGAGIHNAFAATMVVAGSTISGNIAGESGGGVANVGILTITGTTIDGNRATAGDGGGLSSAPAGALAMANSTISSNTTTSASTDGGGLWVFVEAGKTVSLTNVTLSGNGAINNGGGIFKDGPGTLHVVNATLFNNTAGASARNIASFDGLVRVLNTILSANNNTDTGCGGATFVSHGGNVAPVAVCGFSVGAGDRIAAPLLGPLTGNGGVTQTHRPLVGSPAVDGGRTSALVGGVTLTCPTIDQRGVFRPQDGDGNGSVVCDSGAVETARPGANPPATSADLAVTKVESQDPVVAGVGALVYAVTVTNLGPATATGVVVQDLLPAGWTFVRGDFRTGAGGAGACGRATAVTPVNCVFGTLAPNQSATAFITVTPVPAVAPQSNTARVTNTSQPDPNQQNNTFTESTTVQ